MSLLGLTGSEDTDLGDLMELGGGFMERRKLRGHSRLKLGLCGNVRTQIFAWHLGRSGVTSPGARCRLARLSNAGHASMLRRGRAL
jgi:hypothetical protein